MVESTRIPNGEVSRCKNEPEIASDNMQTNVRFEVIQYFMKYVIRVTKLLKLILEREQLIEERKKIEQHLKTCVEDMHATFNNLCELYECCKAAFKIYIQEMRMQSRRNTKLLSKKVHAYYVESVVEENLNIISAEVEKSKQAEHEALSALLQKMNGERSYTEDLDIWRDVLGRKCEIISCICEKLLHFIMEN